MVYKVVFRPRFSVLSVIYVNNRQKKQQVPRAVRDIHINLLTFIQLHYWNVSKWFLYWITNNSIAIEIKLQIYEQIWCRNFTTLWYLKVNVRLFSICANNFFTACLILLNAPPLQYSGFYWNVQLRFLYDFRVKIYNFRMQH